MISELKGQEINCLSENFPCVVKGAVKHCLQRECGRYTEEQIYRAIMNGTFQPCQWKDSSLGYPEISHHYSRNITPGWKIIFAMGGQNFEIHTNANGSQIAMPIYRSDAEAKKCIQDIQRQYGLPVPEVLTHNANTVSSTWDGLRDEHSRALKFFRNKYPDAMRIRKDKLVYSGASQRDTGYNQKDFTRAVHNHLSHCMMPTADINNRRDPLLLSVKIDWSHNATEDRIEIKSSIYFDMGAREVDPTEYQNLILPVDVHITQRGIVVRKENHLEIQITDSEAHIGAEYRCSPGGGGMKH